MSTHGPLFHSPAVPPLRGFAETIHPCLAGESVAMRRVRSQLQRIAPYMRTALITGEAGTGKEVVARALHARGPGADGPFVVWNAAEFAERLMVADQGGALLLEAHGGTLFLRKVEEVSLLHQPTLLRLMQQQQRCDVRIVGSSEQGLRTLMTMGQFREDLYRRIAAVEIGLVPLRKRPEDLAEIVQGMLGGEISAEVVARLKEYDWPGNIRELRRVMSQASALAGTDAVEARHLLLPEAQRAAEPRVERLERLQDVVQRHVLEVLTRCSGNKLRASEVLGISRSTLYRMLDAFSVGGDPGLPE